jgi:TfoX/Sxy family transcriptional regulator of competence genes
MAYSKPLADDVRMRIGRHTGVTEREMFGGIGFMVEGNMAVGVSGDELMVRVGKDAYEEALSRPGVHPFDMSGREMKGWILVSPAGLDTDAALDSWIEQGVAFAGSLPPK